MGQSNSEIADRLIHLAQLLSPQKANFYRVKAYQRAAARLRTLPESVDSLTRENADLTQFPCIGKAIASAIREIVETGTLTSLEELRSKAPSELADLYLYPRLDSRRVLQIYKRFKISSIEALRQKLESGD